MAEILAPGRASANERAAPMATVLAYLPAAVLGLVCAYLLAMILSQAFFASPAYDDSWYGSVARNFAAGRGYITSYGETEATFSAEVSVGPALLLPAAALHLLLGSHYWVNGLAMALVVVPAAALLGWTLHTRYGAGLLALAALAVVLALFVNERSANGDIYRFGYLWSRLMGELPAIMLTLLSAALVCLPGRSRSRYAFAGALLALALYTKVFVLLTFPAFALVGAWKAWQDRDALGPAAFLAAGAAVCLSAEAFRLAALGSWGAYWDNTKAVYHFYEDWRTGGAYGHSLTDLAKAFSITYGIIAVIGLAALVAHDRIRHPAATETERAGVRLGLLLLIAGGATAFWWVVINDSGWARHAVPAVAYLAVALTLLVATARLEAVRYAGIAVLAIVLVTQADAINGYTPPIGREDRLQALLGTSEYLREAEGEGVSFWGCGWWADRDLDFVADVHFYDCTDAASVWKRLDAGERLILVRSEYWNWENDAGLAALAADCDRRTLYSNPPFTACDATSWLRSNRSRP